jgi:hypothetical protein
MPGMSSGLTRSTIAWRFVREGREDEEPWLADFFISCERDEVAQSRCVCLCLVRCLG